MFTEYSNAARIQFRNFKALMLRDVMMRYGRQNIGFAWFILEPMILTLGVMTIWTFAFGGDSKGSIPMVEFVLTGYMPLTLWRHMTNNMVQIVRRSSNLLYHGTITLFDIVFARLLLEFIGGTAAFLVVWGSLYLAGIVSGIARLDLLIVGWLMMAWLAFGAALIFAAVTEYLEVAERFVQPVQYLSIPISGAFALVEWLPAWAQDYILLNPMVHCYEVFRAGYFGDGLATHYWPLYFSVWAFVLLAIGLFTLQQARRHINLS